ncbi:GAP1-N1 domain-containing protein [Xanthomonas sacchari]|uniref:GAP1-N1 domain-containing protein n=1 Tax=Xanthomonas sacchari TaxID=56458 RepID=UPI0035270184
MADAVTRVRIKVEQTLHGYSEGHRLIAGSLRLPQSDARTMLVLSDASGSGSRIPASGYITGYPLAESGKYVIARTWAAPEMSRPGCVWTHSFLIDFADLARLGSVDDLLERFQRPSSGGGSSFAIQLEVLVSREPTPVVASGLGRARPWASALYGKPTGRIIDELERPEDEELVVAIWMQQWPRLRRAFRFCTFSTEDRSTSADAFDLQLMDVSRTTRSKVPDGVIASAKDGGDWLETLLHDLEAPTESGLRQFLRDVGSDVTNGRAAMVPLIHLYEALKPQEGASRLAKAVSELERLGPGQGRMGRAAAARRVFSRPELVDQTLFDFALQQVLADRDLLGVEPLVLGSALLRWRPELLADDLSEVDPLHKAVNAALLEADVDELIDLIGTVPGTTVRVLQIRPDVIEHASFWRIASLDAPKLISALDASQDEAIRIVVALMEAGRDECSAFMVDHFGIDPVVAALSSLDIAGIRSRLIWVQRIARRLDELAEGMSHGVISHRPLLFALSEILNPDAVPNSVGTDPWVTAVERTRPSDDVPSEDLLASFLFARARGWCSRSAGRLFFLSVQRLHDAMASGRLTDSAWRVAKPRLPAGPIWREWDQCEKLRHAVVDSFIDRKLPPIEFGTVVDNGKLWEALVNLAADSFAGRRYLDKVRIALRGGGEAWWVERAKIIDRKVV